MNKQPPYKGHDAEMIARIAHEACREFCMAMGESAGLPWESADPDLRASAISGVKAHIDKELTPAESHNLWTLARIRDGWTYAPVKNEYLKVHPNLVAYSELPAKERIKDFLFTAIVGAFKLAKAEQDEQVDQALREASAAAREGA